MNMIEKIPVIGGPHDGAEYSVTMPASPVLALPVRYRDGLMVWDSGPEVWDPYVPIPQKNDYRLHRYVLRGNPLRYVYEYLVTAQGTNGDGRFPTSA